MKADALTLEGRLVLLRPTAVLLAFPAAPTDVGEGMDGERPARFMDIEKVSVIPTLERKATDIATTVLRYSAVEPRCKVRLNAFAGRRRQHTQTSFSPALGLEVGV